MGHNSQPKRPHAIPDSTHSRQLPTGSQREYDHDVQRNSHSIVDGERCLSRRHRIFSLTFRESCHIRQCIWLLRRLRCRVSFTQKDSVLSWKKLESEHHMIYNTYTLISAYHSQQSLQYIPSEPSQSCKCYLSHQYLLRVPFHQHKLWMSQI